MKDVHTLLSQIMLIVIMFDTAMKQDSQVVLGGFERGGGGG